jgi:ribonuclease HI
LVRRRLFRKSRPRRWGTIVEQGGKRRELSGGSSKATNNQMEIQAMIEGLKTTQPGTSVRIITDSEYVMKGATQWVKGWIRNGWKTASKQPVKNQELWQECIRCFKRARTRSNG